MAVNPACGRLDSETAEDIDATQCPPRRAIYQSALRLLRASLKTAAVLFVLTAVGTAFSQSPINVPRTHEVASKQAEAFRFVIMGDRTGGHRPDVFANAVDHINLLNPDFVMCVGDLIEGYTEDRNVVEAQWLEFESIVDRLQMPFYYTVGNHDISNAAMADIWRERRGADYYYFVANHVLFLVLNTEDPPVAFSPELLVKTRRLESAMRANPEATQQAILARAGQMQDQVKLPGSIAISDEQVSWALETLERYVDVEWTFVLMHKPAWQYQSPAFARIEVALQDRPYSVIAGHEHYYQHQERFGRDYIVAATTGGVWLRDGPGRFDHLLHVSMTPKGPKFLNIKTDAMFDKHGPLE